MAKKQVATFLGPNLGLSIAGDHAYAYSGEFSTTTAAQTCLFFTTPKQYIMFEAYFTGPTQFTDPTAGREANWQVSLNGSVIATAHTDTSEGDIINQPQLKFLVPPLTTVKIEVDGNDSASLMMNCVILTGRVYD